MMEH